MDVFNVHPDWKIESWLNNIQERELFDFISFFSATSENEESVGPEMKKNLEEESTTDEHGVFILDLDKGSLHCEDAVPKKPRHRCNHCGKCFSQSGVLKTHSLIHKGVRPYACSVCNKRFLFTWHLRRHSLTHSGVKPYSCELCGKQFNQSSNLKRHFPTHFKEKNKVRD
ncbi:Zinc finger protein 596 [Blattella germanica]|nr:Zinc finger protein 596 [Blattella germanica]